MTSPSPAAPAASARSERTPWLRQPALHFAVLAALLLVGDAATTPEDRRSLDPTVAEAQALAQLQADFQTANGRPMSDEEQAAALADHRYEQALFDAAIATELHRTDPIVRRRLVQRMRILIERLAPVPPATDAQLQEVVTANPALFPPVHTLSFDHRFFARSEHGEGTLEAAERALAALRRGEPVDSDPFPRRLPTTRADLAYVARVVGPEAAAAISEGPPDTWTGPIPGPYGAHLVRLIEREVRAPRLDEVRRRAESLWERQVREAQGREFARSIVGSR